LRLTCDESHLVFPAGDIVSIPDTQLDLLHSSR
jgi:hypothetical protein